MLSLTRSRLGGNHDSRNVINTRNGEREEAKLVNPRARENRG
jgi:hypothetical protein